MNRSTQSQAQKKKNTVTFKHNESPIHNTTSVTHMCLYIQTHKLL